MGKVRAENEQIQRISGRYAEVELMFKVFIFQSAKCGSQIAAGVMLWSQERVP